MDYNQAGRQSNIGEDNFFAPKNEEKLQSGVVRPEYDLNLSRNSYQSQGNKVLDATLEKDLQVLKQVSDEENRDINARSIELTMPPVVERTPNIEHSTSEVSIKNNLATVKTGENLSREAVELIEKNNRDFNNGAISPEQFYDDARKLMLANLDNSYNRKISV